MSTVLSFALPSTVTAVQAHPYGTGYGSGVIPIQVTLTAGVGTMTVTPTAAGWCWIFRHVGVDGTTRAATVADTGGTTVDYLTNGAVVTVNPIDFIAVPATVGPSWQADIASISATASAAVASVASKVDKDAQTVDANDHGVAGAGDRTAALQSFLNARAAGDTVLLPGGTLRIDGTITISVNSLTVRARRSTVWDRSAADPTTDGIRVTGTGVTIERGSILSPAAWFDANATPTYGVVHVTATDCTIDGLTLTNVPKIGIFSQDSSGLRVTGCVITGNYVGPQRDTGHYALLYDPPATGTAARIHGNIFRSCVQGVFIGNWGAASNSGASADIVGNVFESCFNHGIYNAGIADGVAVSGNKFHHCQTPIALTGANHTVTGNTLTTSSTGSADLADITGMSFREPVGCTITGNVIYGDGSGDVIGIDLANYVANSHTIGRNVVAGNTIYATNAAAGIGIRVGNGNTQVLHDNLVANNTIYSTGKALVGVISVSPAAGAVGYGNAITGNNVVVQGSAHGIYVGVVKHCNVRGNNIRFEYDAPSATTLGGIYLISASNCNVSGNDIYCPPTFGTNVTVRGVWEDVTCSGNSYRGNSYLGDLTKLAAFAPMSIQPSTNAYIDELLPGAPTLYAAPGSRFMRSDGGAGTTLYVKETPSSSNTWRAV